MQNRIKELRIDMELKQTELAASVGIDASVLSKLESNFRQPNKSNVAPLADFFQVSIDYLLGYSEEYIKVIYYNSPTKESKYYLSNEEYKILRPDYIFYDGNKRRQFMKEGPEKLTQMRGIEEIMNSNAVVKRFENKIFSKLVDDLATLTDEQIVVISQTVKMIKGK